MAKLASPITIRAFAQMPLQMTKLGRSWMLELLWETLGWQFNGLSPVSRRILGLILSHVSGQNSAVWSPFNSEIWSIGWPNFQYDYGSLYTGCPGTLRTIFYWHICDIFRFYCSCPAIQFDIRNFQLVSTTKVGEVRGHPVCSLLKWHLGPVLGLILWAFPGHKIPCNWHPDTWKLKAAG